MDTKILAAKNLLKDFFGGYGTSYAIGIGFTILVLFFVSKMSKFITDIFSLPFQIFRTVQSMLLIAQLVLFAFVAIVLYKISVILSLSAPSPSFVADERGVRNVKEEQVNVEISETPKKEKTAEKNTKEKENNELSEEAQIAAILARLDEYDLTPTRRQKFWYNLKLFFWQHSLDIIVTIALIFAYRIFSDWRAKKHQRNIRYRNSLREKARQARRKKNFWLDPIGTIVNLPYFSVFGASIGEDGEIEIEMEEQGRENVMVPNAPNAPKQKQNKMSKILDFAQKHKKTIFFVIATIITTMITILVVRYLLRKKQTEPNLPGIDISEEEKDMDEQEDANDEYDERQEKEEDRGKEEEENELSLEESEKGNDEDEERKKKEEEALILELSEDMDQQENNQEGEESEDYVSLEPSEEDNLDVLSSKLDDEEAEEESEESNEEGGEQTTSVLTDQEVAEGEEGQKAKKTPIWGILSTLVLVVAIL